MSWGCLAEAVGVPQGGHGNGALPGRLGGWPTRLGLLGFRQVAARMRLYLFFLWLAYLYLAVAG